MSGYVLPPPSPHARNVDPERDAALLRLDDEGTTLTEIGRRLGMSVNTVQKRLIALRERLADAAQKEADRARRGLPPPPERRRCRMCPKWLRPKYRGEWVCETCRGSDAWRAGAGPESALAGAAWKR